MLGAWCPSVITDLETEIKRWESAPPPVEQVRPSHCAHCQVASRPPGAALRVVGHGVRQRQVRGPLQVGKPPRQVLVFLRRYLCRQCERTMTVGPRVCLRQRLYSAGAVRLALTLWGLFGLSVPAIREQICTWTLAEETGWRSLRRWILQALGGQLWPLPGGAPGGVWTRREQVAWLVRQWVVPEFGEEPRHFAHRALCAAGGGR